MTNQTAKTRLEKLGFTFPSGNWGRIEAELYSTGKDHFIPRFRDVFFAKCNGGFYVTSGINGVLRRFRCRHSYETSVANIFGGGATLAAAIAEFVQNFEAKTYNIFKP